MEKTPQLKRDFTEGPLFFRITLFALPIMLTGVLQIAYSMADNIVVGKFSGDVNALAAIGSTGALNTFIINLLLGIAAGTGIVVAQYYGAKENGKLSRCVHTAMLFSIVGGIVFGAVGLLISKPALVLLETKPEILDAATLYLRIVCIGIPANSVYNFGASILRATGNSKQPLIILGTTGLVNVVLNLVFVIGCGMSVDGVAIATIISQYLSAIAVVFLLYKKRNEPFGLSFSKLSIDKAEFLKILRYGVPSGIQSSMFSIANMVMINAVNTFPTTTVTAHTIASNIDGLAFTAMNGFGQSAVTFTGQNCGAKKPERIKRAVLYCVIQETVAVILISTLEFVFARQLVSLYIERGAEDAGVITDAAVTIMTVMLASMVLSGLLDAFTGALKGLGYTLTAMMTSLICICGIRLVWITFGFPLDVFNSLTGLYLAYPISWFIALITVIVCLLVAFNRFKKKLATEGEEQDAAGESDGTEENVAEVPCKENASAT